MRELNPSGNLYEHVIVIITYFFRNMYNSLNFLDIDQLVCIKGLLIRSSPILPEMAVGTSLIFFISWLFELFFLQWIYIYIAFFRCSICDKSVEVEVDRSKIDEPSRCPRKQCNSSGTMVLIHNRSIFKDKQVCRLQETPGRYNYSYLKLDSG
jgi:DNA replication licensing factor MCM4